MSNLLLSPDGIAAVKRAFCHEIRRRMARMFHRTAVIAINEYMDAGTIDLDTVVGQLNPEHDDEILAHYYLLEEPTLSCAIQGPQGEQGEQGPQGEQGEQGPQGEQGEPGEPGTSFIVYGEYEPEYDLQPYTSFHQVLQVQFTAEAETIYQIQYNWEFKAATSEDVEGQCTVQEGAGAQNEIAFGFHKADTYAYRWSDVNGGMKVYDGVSNDFLTAGTITVRINGRNAYGSNGKWMQRARILVTQLS